MDDLDSDPKIGDYLRALQSQDHPELPVQAPHKHDYSPTETKDIEINLSLPRIRLPKLGFSSHDKLQLIWHRRWLFIASTVIVLALFAFVILKHFLGNSNVVATNAYRYTSSELVNAGNPGYTTLLPKGKSIEQLGGWYRISPPNNAPVYAFADHTGNATLDISEQPLPDSFTNDTATQVANLAKSFGANQKLTVQGTTVYISISAKGFQSVICTRDNLLILIKSTAVLTNDQWTSYIAGLH